MTKEQKHARIRSLWQKARRYTNKLRLQARLQKMSEQNLREMMIEDIQDDDEDDSMSSDNQNKKISWYLIDTERTFCKTWDFMITCLTIYELFVVPVIMVFPQLYVSCLEVDNPAVGLDAGSIENIGNSKICASGVYDSVTDNQKTLKNIELAIDIIYCIEICLCFVKKTIARDYIKKIVSNYMRFYFWFDVIGTIPELVLWDEGINFYPLKLFRFVHVYRLHKPFSLLMKRLLSKYSKKRQNDLITFMILILTVIYISHIHACFWLFLGGLEDCGNGHDDQCIKSWIFANDFDNKPLYT